MRLLVFFDLPVTTKKSRKIATRFRNRLLKDGFFMLQFSVYCRICRGQDSVNKHINRLKSNPPEYGNIRILQVTDKQFSKMHLLTGKKKKVEEIGAKQLVLF